MEFEWKESKGRQTFVTISEHLYWSYANLAMAHAALKSGDASYRTFPHFQIRSKFYKGLRSGTIQIGPLYDDERLKLIADRHCAYCGDPEADTADHLIPKARGGSDVGDNLVLACRSCNAAKGSKDAMAWHKEKRQFPALTVVRRYLKIATIKTQALNLMNTPANSADARNLPYDVSAVPMVYPPPALLRWEIAAAPDAGVAE